jgi:hypothetical protein
MAVKFKGDINTRRLQSLRKKVKDLRTPVTRQAALDIGKAVVKKMREMIGRGVNPIKGWGKYPAYRGGYRKQIRKKGYVSVDGAKYSKRLRPVNLKLTGQFLRSLSSKTRKWYGGHAAIVGYYKSTKSQKKEDGHRTGHNAQAERPTIPQASLNEDFKKPISSLYIKIINRAIKKIADRKR